MPLSPSPPGRAVARIGLRMMPPFPPLSLKFRKAGFPHYGFKVGISDSAFPSTASSSRRAVCLRPSCTPLPIAPYPRSKSRHAQAAKPLYPRGPRSGPSYAVSVHLHLIGPIRPTRQHIATSPQMRFIRHAFAVPKGLGDQRVVPGFRCLLLLCMSSSRIPGNPSTVYAQLHRRRLRPSP